MAQISIVKKATVFAVVAVAFSTVTISAQALALSPKAGVAFSVPAYGVMIGTSLILSFVALFKN